MAVCCGSLAGAEPALGEPCDSSAANAIACENSLPGSPASEWDVVGVGDLTIQGFATDISVNRGETVHFKVSTDAAAYHIDIYRLGWYQGLGARKVATLLPSASLPQAQPAPLHDLVTGLIDCGNWEESASWAVPAEAVSGIYIARLLREDTGGASHMIFIVRDDSSASRLLFQTSDATWQAYNNYGYTSLYEGHGLPNGHASKVSYNRPFFTRGIFDKNWVFNAEFPMLRWLERNGYDVTYTTDMDTDRRGALLGNHRVFLSVGHDEYWSGPQRANVEAARDSGVNLAFFSGNEIYWKTRWEPSIDGSGTPHRTLVCYKEGTLGYPGCGGKCDPLADVWTGLWRDGCAFTPPADGCDPENALSGQISYMDNTLPMEVPSQYAPFRFWRNTPVVTLGANETLELEASSLGFEWDFEQYSGSYPAGRVTLSRTVQNGRTHHLALYRHASGALVFGAGTVQWSWGLDSVHDRGLSMENAPMKQATVNLLAEMGVEPVSLEPGLVVAPASGDLVAPVSTIGSPLDAASVAKGLPITISGTSVDAAGVVAGVEVSVDGGNTWNPATGGVDWTFQWTPESVGPATILCRSFDDLGNLEASGSPESPRSKITVKVIPWPQPNCPCTLWASGPGAGEAAHDSASIEVGVKFQSDVDGLVTGVRFFKHPANLGPHVGHLWKLDGTLLGTATFSSEADSGWQQASFDSTIAITANTTYVVSCFMPGGDYFFSDGYFATSSLENPPLHAPRDGTVGGNGVFVYSPAGGFPTDSFNARNYWVDVILENSILVATTGGIPGVTLARPPYPNPARDRMVFEYDVGTDLARGSVPVELSLYDLLGRQVRVLHRGSEPPGHYRLAWDMRDDRGARLAAGLYYYRFEAGARAARGMVTVLR